MRLLLDFFLVQEFHNHLSLRHTTKQTSKMKKTLHLVFLLIMQLPGVLNAGITIPDKNTTDSSSTETLNVIPVVVEKHNNILNIASSELIKSVSIEGINRPIEESQFVAVDITGATGTIEISVETTSGIYESEIDTEE